MQTGPNFQLPLEQRLNQLIEKYHLPSESGGNFEVIITEGELAILQQNINAIELVYAGLANFKDFGMPKIEIELTEKSKLSIDFLPLKTLLNFHSQRLRFLLAVSSIAKFKEESCSNFLAASFMIFTEVVESDQIDEDQKLFGSLRYLAHLPDCKDRRANDRFDVLSLQEKWITEIIRGNVLTPFKAVKAKFEVLDKAIEEGRSDSTGWFFAREFLGGNFLRVLITFENQYLERLVYIFSGNWKDYRHYPKSAEFEKVCRRTFIELIDEPILAANFAEFARHRRWAYGKDRIDNLFIENYKSYQGIGLKVIFAAPRELIFPIILFTLSSKCEKFYEIMQRRFEIGDLGGLLNVLDSKDGAAKARLGSFLKVLYRLYESFVFFDFGDYIEDFSPFIEVLAEFEDYKLPIFESSLDVFCGLITNKVHDKDDMDDEPGEFESLEARIVDSVTLNIDLFDYSLPVQYCGYNISASFGVRLQFLKRVMNRFKTENDLSTYRAEELINEEFVNLGLLYALYRSVDYAEKLGISLEESQDRFSFFKRSQWLEDRYKGIFAIC